MLKSDLSQNMINFKDRDDHKQAYEDDDLLMNIDDLKAMFRRSSIALGQ